MKENTMLSQEEILKIQKSVDIVDIISGYLPLTSKGKNFFGVCPFHSDHSPSMSVSREKQIYKCFACGASGNVFNFIMNYENVSFIDAVKMLASKAGIPISIGTYKSKTEDKDQILYDILDISLKFYKNNINTKEGKSAIEYIKNRHFDLNIIKDFEIGLSLNKYDSLTNLLIKKNFKQTDMINSGLVSKNEKGIKDTYVNRIMFPIHNLNGKLVGYSGRIYNGEKTNKYVNTKETDIFKKSEILYNYHKAKDFVREKDEIIIVEGFFALIRLYTIGVKNVVATLGTAFTKNHALTIKRMTKNVILCFDGDSAGDKATNSCITELNKVGITPKIIRLEENLDPDDYIIKYGKNKMIDKINNPMNVMDYKLLYHSNNKDLSNTKDLSDYINEMLDELKKIDDDIYRELTLKKLSDISKLSVEVLKTKLDESEDIIEPIQKVPTLENKKKLNKYELAERNLIYYMMNSKDVVLKYNREQISFSNINYEELAKNIILYIKKYKEIELSSLMTYYMDNENIIKTINELLSYNIKDNFSEQQINDYIKVIKERKTKQQISKLKNNINLVKTKEEQKNILKQMIELRKKEIEGEKYD